MHDLFIDQIHLARRWKISHRTLERWRWIKQGPNYTKLGRKVVYHLDDVIAFEARGLQVVNPPAVPSPTSAGLENGSDGDVGL